MTIYQRDFFKIVRVLMDNGGLGRICREARIAPIFYDLKITQNTPLAYRKALATAHKYPKKHLGYVWNARFPLVDR